MVSDNNNPPPSHNGPDNDDDLLSKLRGSSDSPSGPEGPEGPDNKPEGDDIATKAQKAASGLWDSKAMRVVRWPLAISGLTAAFKVASWGVKRKNNLAKAFVVAASLGTLGAYWGAGYVGYSYGNMKFWDARVDALNWPAGEGDRTGRIVRFSEKGSWPCNSFELRLQIGDASTNFEDFAIERFDTDMVRLADEMQKHGRVTITYRHSKIAQRDFAIPETDPETGETQMSPTTIYGCFRHHNRKPISIVPAPVGPGQ